MTTRDDQYGVKPQRVEVQREVVVSPGKKLPLTEQRGRVLAYMYRQGGRPCYGQEITAGADLSTGHVCRVFDDFVNLGWIVERREGETEGGRAGRSGRALRRYGTLTEQGVNVLPEFVARYGTLLGDLSTLPPPAAGTPVDESAHKLGQMIRLARQRSGLTVREAARRAGKAQSWLSYLMAGVIRQPNPAEVGKLVAVLSMPAAEAADAMRLVARLGESRSD